MSSPNTSSQLVLFGDQTFDFELALKNILLDSENILVRNLLDRSYHAVRAEIYALPQDVRNNFPRLTCAEDLLARDYGDARVIAMDMALTALCHASSYLKFVNAQRARTKDTVCLTSRFHRQLESYSTSQDVQLHTMGLCTGSLVAAALSCSQDSQDFISLAVHAIRIAFKIGVRVAEAVMQLGASTDDNGQTWSIVVASSGAQALEEFKENNHLNRLACPYLSATSPASVTISGPPRSLSDLVSAEVFAGLRYKNISIHGPYHASHIYSEQDVQDVLDISDVCPLRSQKLPFFTNSGEMIAALDFSGLLQVAAHQILQEPILWPAILARLQTHLIDIKATSFTVVPVGTTADQLICASLRQTLPQQDILSVSKRPQTKSAQISSGASSQSNCKLAIVGMSGRFPSAKDTDAFWGLLYDGLDVHKAVPALHWDAKTHVDPTGTHKNTSAVSYGCWLDDPAAFDARFFNISPREAPQIDPAQRLALMTAYEALEQAGIVPDSTPSTRPDRVGVFYGVTSNDWMETNSAQNIDTYFIPGGNRAFIPGRINYCFKFSGPSYSVDTACSSSLAGIHLACNSLWRGDIDTAIAGGTNVLTNPDFTAGLDRGHFLSRTGNCKTFDDGADGYCRGEGIGTIIMKRLDDALADQDPILGVILGANTNHSAESESITRPHSGAQRAIFRKILNQAGVDPYSVSYVEMHGTGTQAGDAGEMKSVLETFAPSATAVDKLRTEKQPLYLGSAKANIGHGEAASGVSSVIKVLLMMQRNMIPPHCGIKSVINRRFPSDLEARNVQIARQPTAWNKDADSVSPRRVFVNNFSAAGGNSALLIEDAPVRDNARLSTVDPRTLHLIAVSAKTGTSEQGNLKSLLEYVRREPQMPLNQLSYTTTARRMHHQHRAIFAVSSTQELSEQLEVAIKDGVGSTRPKGSPKIVFAFTGQGAQYPGMGRDLLQHFSTYRKEILRLDHLSQGLGFPSILPFLESEETDVALFSSIVIQLANVCMQIALVKLWSSWNIKPAAVVGHSLGEYAALNTAGVLSDVDCLYMVGRRAQLLEEHCILHQHSMLVVKGAADEIAAVLKEHKFEFACINSAIETVLAGPNNQISSFRDVLSNAGMRSTPLKVSFAFHSSQMDPILSSFKEVASTVQYSPPAIPVICPLSGQVIAANDNSTFGADYLTKHMRQPVDMLRALQVANESGHITKDTPVVEIGPHPAISGMIRPVLGTQIPCFASAQRARQLWQVICGALKGLYVLGADIKWAEYHRDFDSCKNVVAMPAYSWDLKDYWIQYVNDWSLRKGDAVPTPDPVVLRNGVPQSTTIHRIVEENGDEKRSKLVAEANIARKDLSPLVQGHEVDGIPLCTPSVYADMALTIGEYLLRTKGAINGEKCVNITNMSISKALILREDATEQMLQAHVDADWTKRTADIKFMSFSRKAELQEHARCTLQYTDGKLQQQLQNELRLFKQKEQKLREGISSGETARFNRAMAYRAIRPLARFHDDYRAIDEVVLNSNTLEAFSKLSYSSVKRDGIFHTHPAIIDSLTQSCGFTMNCNDKSDLDAEVFMNHGWGSFQLFEPIDFDKVYSTYTQMQPGPDKLWYGDVTVVDDTDRVVAHLGSIAIQGVPRRVLKVILSIESGNKPAKALAAQPKPAVAAPAIQSAALATMPVVKVPVVSASGPRNSQRINKAFKIISEESGLAVEDLTDGTNFADVGIDSLLGLTISARFKDELEQDLDFGSFFLEYPTIASLRAFLSSGDENDAPVLVGQESTVAASETGSIFDSSSTHTRATTPSLDDKDGPTSGSADFSKALQIIAEESGLAIAELTEDTSFADFGIDSLLSLIIASRFRDELGLDIQHESLVLEYPTLLDLKRLMLPEILNEELLETPTVSKKPALEKIQATPTHQKLVAAVRDQALQASRKEAIDVFLARYGSGFQAPSAAPALSPAGLYRKTVVVTGATGSLGGHLVYHLAQMPDIYRVVCLNRAHHAEPVTRQNKAMRDKGIRFPDALRHKLVIYQTDTALPKLGLADADYARLIASCTHLIHQAWPMSAKRALDGFETQFQVMRNLVDFARDVACSRPATVKFSFQLVSSIGVVGHYGLGDDTMGLTKTLVPEDRAQIESVLPNGYSEAKWGCERMLDQTLHHFPERFRTMTVRLGQIAGSRTSGYWNPMEHFGFLVKSSQTLRALPDVDGEVYWTPVNDIAAALSDLVLAERTPYPVYHIENPISRTWREVNAVLADALQIPERLPFAAWVERVRSAGHRDNPAATLLEFLDSNYLRMSCGGLVLDTQHTLEHSPALNAAKAVSDDVVRKYIHIWREIGFLSAA